MYSFIGTIHWWNIRLTPPIGLFANFWLFWLVLYRTPKEMKMHSRILLQTAVFDSIFLIISSIGTPMLIFAPNAMHYIHDGLFYDCFYAIFGTPGAIALHYVYYGFLVFDFLSISVQFAYRYLLLNHNIHIGIRRYLMLLIVPSIGVFAVSIYIFIFLQPTMKVQTENGQSLIENKISFTYYPNDIQFYIYLGFVYSFFILASIVITYCAIKMVNFVKAHNGFSENLKCLNKQLTKTLIILAALPCLAMLVGIFITLNGAISLDQMIGANSNIVGQAISNQLLILLPCLNPLISILTNTPYRNAIIFWRKTRIEAQMQA